MPDNNAGTIGELKKLLEQETPRLLYKELQDFVKYYLDRRDTYLSVMERHPSPLYILETTVLRQKASQFYQAFSAVLPNVACFYAVKSNSYPEVSRVLVEEGYGLDVSSGLELKRALSTNTHAIIFSGPGKTNNELSRAVAHADRVTVLMDSFGELDRLNNVASEQNRIVTAGIRITTNSAGVWRKFGIPLGELGLFFKAASLCPNVSLTGIQFHTSWNLTPEKQCAVIRSLGKVISNLTDTYRKQISFIDIGGGYWPPQGEWLQPAAIPTGILGTALGKTSRDFNMHYKNGAVSIGVFSERLAAEIKARIFPHLRCAIHCEPGRWLCNDAMHIMVTVIDKKAPDCVITDGATNAVGWERFESDYCPILNLSTPSLLEKKCDILGSLCTPRDIWGYSYFGKDILPGDILLVPCQGAYTYSLRQEFIKPVPEVVVI